MLPETPWYVAAYGEHYFQTYGSEWTPEQTQTDVDGALSLLTLSPPSRVLDLCCGFGRHTLELARRGFEATGLDLSSALLQHARQAAACQQLSVEWVQADMRAIQQPPVPYDAVLCLFSSWGVFDGTQDEQQVARAVARVLAPGGRLVVDTINREVTLKQWMPLWWRELPDGTLVNHRLRFDFLSGILHSQEMVVSPDGARRTDMHQLRLWSASEFASLLEGAGLTDVQVWGGLDGTPYSQNAHRMVVTARKPR